MSDLMAYSIKWNTHSKVMSTYFDGFVRKEEYVDVTLSCSHSSLKAHKLVLAASSPYFKRLIDENPCQHPTIVFKDIEYDDMQLLLDFIYTGEMNVPADRLEQVVAAAGFLQIRGLCDNKEATKQYSCQPEEESDKVISNGCVADQASQIQNLDVNNVPKPIPIKTQTSKSKNLLNFETSTQLKEVEKAEAFASHCAQNRFNYIIENDCTNKNENLCRLVSNGVSEERPKNDDMKNVHKKRGRRPIRTRQKFKKGRKSNRSICCVKRCLCGNDCIKKMNEKNKVVNSKIPFRVMNHKPNVGYSKSMSKKDDLSDADSLEW